MNKLRPIHAYGLITLFGLIFFIPFLGGVHLFDWDEINFAESAREMIVSGNYLDVQINFQPFWEKPPLFIWIQVLSMKVFGINEFAARFPNAICGILSLLSLFNVGRKFRDEKFAWLWVLSYAGSVLPFFYFKSGIIDPWFNLFIFLGVVHFVYYVSETTTRQKNLFLSALFIGLAILTKGPVAFLIFIISFIIFLFIRKFKIKTSFLDVLNFSVMLGFVGGFWFILQILNGNNQVVLDFINYQIRLFTTEDAGHGGFLLYHFVILLVGVFPASVFAIPGFMVRDPSKTYLRLWMFILFWTVLLLFTFVNTKIVHYSSLCYFPLTFFAAIYLYKLIAEKNKVPMSVKILILCLSGLYGVLLSLFPFVEKYKDIIIDKGWIKDAFTQGNLMANVEWTGLEPVVGLFYIAAIWIFIYNMNKDITRNVTLIFISTLIFTFLSIVLVTPRIEEHSQRAAIEFYSLRGKEDGYITTLGFKSYAHIFYGSLYPSSTPHSNEDKWLLEGNVDKPVYVVFKISRRERYLKQYPQLKVLYEKNGFVFTQRSDLINTLKK